MDRASKPLGWQGRVAVLFAAIAGPMSGCAHIPGLRGHDAPAIGSAGGSTVDPYLAHHGTKPKGESAALASVEPEGGHPSTRTADAMTSGDGGGSGLVPTEVVSLGSPVALPTANHPGPSPSPSPAPADEPRDDVNSVIARAHAAVEAMTTYQVAINRQERVGDALLPAEDVRLSVRRAPKAVRLEWPTGTHKGREVLYSASESGGLLHVHMGDSIVPVPDLSLSPDSPMVMKNSRHPITEAGFDALVATLEHATPGASTTYLGVETPPDLGRACHTIERRNAAGETWLFYLDAQTSLPAMVVGTSKSGELLERYLFRDVKPDLPELASADAFDPSKRWGSSVASGLLGRLARSAGDAKTTTTAAPR
jgi:hypothetical protein